MPERSKRRPAFGFQRTGDFFRMKRYLLNIILLLLAGSRLDAVEIQATVNATTISVDQQLVLTIELSGEDATKVPQPTPPDLSEFLSYLGSGGSSQNIQVINGKMSVSRSFTYYYLAKKAGSFTIPAISISYKGKTVGSDPIEITVVGQATTPQQTSNVDLFMRAVVNKRSVYQNEPVIVTFRIYYKTQPSSYGVVKMPETTGFWAEDFDIGRSALIGSQVINGQKWGTADIKKMALFPTSAGKKTIGPMSITCDVPVRSRGRDPFGFDGFFDDPFFNRTQRRELASPAVEIDVKPLPVAGRPAGFSGAVGKFSFNATVDKNVVKTNEAISLKLTISGTGNIHTITAPPVNIPKDFEQYDPQESENISKENDRISGTKQYEYVLVPRFPGEQRIKPIAFSYFDPSAGRYVTLTSPEFVIQVQRGEGEFANVGGGLSKEEVQLVGRDIRFIKTAVQPLQRINYKLYKSWQYLAALILPLVLLALALAQKAHLQKLEGNVAYARSRKANRMAMKRLSHARSLLAESTQKEFYAEVSRALIGFAADKLNLPAAGIISDELEQLLKNKNLSPELIKGYMDLIQACDFQRFAPADVTKPEMQKFYDSAKQAIVKLEKAL